MGEMLNEQRGSWGTRAGFVLAAVGSAVGLGNFIRFPHVAYTNGGGAFLIPYLIATCVVGLPLLIMEFSLGHFTQLAAPGAFRHINKKAEFVGWWPIVLSFVICTYYSVILAWCLDYLIFSFDNGLPWKNDASAFFFDKYLQTHDGFEFGQIRWRIVLALLGVWVAMYFSIFKGVKWIGKVVLWIVPLPLFILFILMIRGLTLDGAVQGLEYYLEPDFSRLSDPKVWIAAFGQVFFSLTVAFGVMITYASFLHRKSDINNNAMIVTITNMSASFIAGIVVFTTMGSLAAIQNVPPDEVLVNSKGLSLAFVAFPTALASMPMAQFFSIIFFAAILMLGINSAFSMTETVLASICDKTKWHRQVVLISMSVVGFLCGIIFTTQGGLSWLGAVDDFINGPFGVILIGLAECIAVGWFFNVSILRRHANARSDWKIGIWWEWMIKYITPCVLTLLCVWSFVVWLNKDKTQEVEAIVSKIQYDGQLSGTAYIMLAIAMLIMFGGLGWCFYRAIGSADKQALEQHPDEIGDDQQ